MKEISVIDLIESKRAVIGVVGLGYVGLPLVLTYARKGFEVVGFDIDPTKIDALNKGKSYIRHIESKDLAEQVDAGRFTATTDFSRTAECDAILLCVPTPLNKNREPDLTYVTATGDAIGPYLRAGQVVVLESTTYPGTTREILKPKLEEISGLSAGRDFYLAYSPEREDPGNANYGTQTIPKVVGGLTPACSEVAGALYRAAIDQVVPVSSTDVAEMTKLLENIFRSVNIALVNELKVLCHRMGIDVWEVIQAASTKPFGYMPFYPGPGLGGHCIPIDPFYLTWKAREYDLNTRFIELAGETNTAMPRYVVARVADALNEHKKPLNGSKVLVLGLAYKKDVDDMRESPSVALIDLLRKRGAEICFHDPYVPTANVGPDGTSMSSLELTDEVLESVDAVLIATAHTGIDYQRICNLTSIVVDTRNATASLTKRGNVYKA